MKSLTVLALSVAFLLCCCQAHSSSHPLDLDSKSLDFMGVEYPTMYEISTRPWLYELSRKYQRNISRLIDIPREEFMQLKSQGVDVVWMMGVWELGQYGLDFDRNNPESIKRYKQMLPDFTMDDVIGSPYAIVNYSLNYELGDMDDLVPFKKMLNNIGLGLMLDFVPNHYAIDNLWYDELELFIRAPKGQNPPYDPEKYLPNGVAYGSDIWGGAWKDTVQLNYWEKSLWELQKEKLLYIASVSDYIRCDMAHLVLNEVIERTWGEQLRSWGYTRPSREFWEEAIGEAKSKYGVKFLAEVYDPWPSTLQRLGFDYTYDKKLYDHLVDGHLDHLRGYLSGNPVNFHQLSAHFVENHDEPRAPIEFQSIERSNAAAFLSFTLPGMRFINHGQLFGYKERLDVHLRRSRSEPKNPLSMTFYTSILTALKKAPVFSHGDWTFLNVEPSHSSWRLIAFKWTSQRENILCVINYSDVSADGRVKLSEAKPRDGNDLVPIHELMENKVYTRSAKEMRDVGLHVVLDAWKGQIFKY